MNIRIKTKEAINNHPLLDYTGHSIKVYDSEGRACDLWRGITHCLGKIVTVRSGHRYIENEHINYSFSVADKDIIYSCITGVVEEVV